MNTKHLKWMPSHCWYLSRWSRGTLSQRAAGGSAMANQHGGGGHQPFLQGNTILFVKHGQGQGQAQQPWNPEPSTGKADCSLQTGCNPAPCCSKAHDRTSLQCHRLPWALLALALPAMSTAHTPNSTVPWMVVQHPLHGELIPSFCAARAHCCCWGCCSRADWLLVTCGI